MNDPKRGKFRRHILVVDPGYQIKYLVYTDLIEVLALGLIFFFSFVLLFWQFTGERVHSARWSDSVEYQLFLLVLLLLVLLIYRSLVRSHQIAGPFVRFRDDFRRVSGGDLSGDFSLRKRDRLQDLAEEYRKMKDGLRHLAAQDRTRAEEARQRVARFRRELESQYPQAAAAFEPALHDLEEVLRGMGTQFFLTPEDKSPGESRQP